MATVQVKDKTELLAPNDNDVLFVQQDADSVCKKTKISKLRPSNKALIETYTQTEVNLADAVTNKHTHTNKATLDTYTQTEVNLVDAVTKKHTANTDTALDTGGANPVTALKVKGVTDRFDGSNKLLATGIATQTKTVVDTTNPTPDYIGQIGIDTNNNKYVAIALTGTMWEITKDLSLYGWQILYTRTRLGVGTIWWDGANKNLVFDNFGIGNNINIVVNRKDATGKLTEVVLGTNTAGIVNVNLANSSANDPSVVCVKDGKLNLGTAILVETAGNVFLANRASVGANDFIIGYLQGSKLSSPILSQDYYLKPQTDSLVSSSISAITTLSNSAVYGVQIKSSTLASKIYYKPDTKKIVFDGLFYAGAVDAVKLLWGNNNYTYLSTSGFALGVANRVEIDLSSAIDWRAAVVLVNGKVQGTTIVLSQANFAIRNLGSVLSTDLIIGYTGFGNIFVSPILTYNYDQVKDWLLISKRFYNGNGNIKWDGNRRMLIFSDFGSSGNVKLYVSRNQNDVYNNSSLVEITLNVNSIPDLEIHLDNLGSNDPSVLVLKDGKVSTSITVSDVSIYLCNRTAVPSTDLILGHICGSKIDTPLLSQITLTDIETLQTQISSLSGTNNLSALTSFMKNEPTSPLTIIGINGDSILASGTKELTYPYLGEALYETPPKNNVSMLQRYIYDYLNFNKPKFRNSNHSDWVTSGTWVSELTAKQPRIDMITYPTANGNYKELIVDGLNGEWLGLVFEGIGTRIYLGTVYGTSVYRTGAWVAPPSTGIANIMIAESSDGGITYTPFALPSTYASVKGKWNKKGFLDINGNEVIENDSVIDNFNTAPVVSGTGTYDECSLFNVYYNFDTSKKYKVRVYQNVGATTNPIRFWGSLQWSGKTLLTTNFSIPGLNWSQITEISKGDYTLSDCRYMFVEAPIYHDNTLDIDSVKGAVTSFISTIKSYANMELCIFSCSPGGISSLGGSVVLGDELPATYPGENVYLIYDRCIDIIAPSVTVAPLFKDTYQVTINSVNYTLSFARLNGSNYSFIAPKGMPMSSIGTTVVLTKLTGSGDATITGSGMTKTIAFTMPEHSYAISQVCVEQNVCYVDALNVFKQIAESHGDVLDALDGFDMPTSHPDYAYISGLVGNPSYPYLSLPIKMNYMSNYFSYADGHHLKFTAHKIFFESFKNLLHNSYFI